MSREEIFESINNNVFNNIKVGNKKTCTFYHFKIFIYLTISLFKNQTKILIMSTLLAIAIC